MFAVCMLMYPCLQTARGTSGTIMHVCVDGCSGLSMRARAPSHQTLLARLPSRLFDRTDSIGLLIRNSRLVRDPPRLPKDAPEWSFVQCHETQLLPVSLSNLDLQTSHLAVTTLFEGSGGYMHSLQLKYNGRDLARIVKQITWKPLQP